MNEPQTSLINIFRRRISPHLLTLLEEFPAVAILGARQVGKTTLAFELAQLVQSVREGRAVKHLDLESPYDYALLNDPEDFFRAHADQFVIIDEVQRRPELFAVLRSVIDARRRAGQRYGQFLLLGSASDVLLQQSSESLAGRLAYVELPPFTFDEIPANDLTTLQRLWLRGGFPDAYLAKSDAASLRWREQFISSYLERDIPQLGVRIPAATLRNFWTMVAHEQGQVFNAARVAASLSISGHTVARYLDVLCDVMLLRRLQPWGKHSVKRLVRAPKVYVRDSGVAHALLSLNDYGKLLSHPAVGGTWEGMMIENVIANCPANTKYSYYRTSAGAEIDLVLELPNDEVWAIEIKRASAPTVSKGFYFGVADVGATHKIVLANHDQSFSLGDGVYHVPLATLQERLRNLS